MATSGENPYEKVSAINQDNKIEIIKHFKVAKKDTEQFTTFLRDIGIKDYGDKLEIIKGVIDSSEDFKYEDLLTITQSSEISIDDKQSRYALLKKFVEKNNTLTVGDVNDKMLINN